MARLVVIDETVVDMTVVPPEIVEETGFDTAEVDAELKAEVEEGIPVPDDVPAPVVAVCVAEDDPALAVGEPVCPLELAPVETAPVVEDAELVASLF